MKFKLKHLLLAAFVLLSGSQLAVNAEIKREHRSVWMSTYLGEWPSAPLNTETNAKRQTSNLKTLLDRMQQNNVNTLYFHVRSYCDACYESAYEPWSEKIAGTRGGTPLLDPLKLIVEECHARGIELYAWVNPYRYSKGTPYETNEKNYETSHPDWLLSRTGETILNPGLPEVRQRIVDVCKDIVTKYDVDGLIFDDYFYSTGTSMSLDADLYNAYTAAGGTMSQADWRRDNVNKMVGDVANMIAETKPYLAFGISPAGRCNPPNASDYGLTDSGMSDWQYNGIYSDPIYWLFNHLIDFVSPQLYWSMPAGFESGSTWWIDAATKAGRHIFVSTSTDLTTADGGGYKVDEYVQQQLHVRDCSLTDQSGLVFFTFGRYNTYREKDPDTGKNATIAELMAKNVYHYRALAPLRHWRNNYDPKMVSNVVLSDSKLSWNGVENGRYTVYAVPETLSDAEFGCQPQYLEAVTYTPEYTIPDDKATGYRWAVAVYDRYGNEYAPLFAGATAGVCAAPRLVSPAAGGGLVPLSNFSWESADGTSFIIEIANDNDAMKMTDIIATFEIDSKTFSSALLPDLTVGKSYLWRVTAMAPNRLNATSAPQRFVADKIKILSPTASEANVSRTPVVTWQKAVDGATYNLELSANEKFSTVRYSVETAGTSVTVPDCTLSTGVTYYARVTATLNGKSVQSDVTSFAVAPAEYTAAPVFTNPTVNGQTVHSNQAITLAPYAGIYDIRVEISETDKFPVRGATFVSSLTNFVTETKPLGEIKIQSNPLVDGKTYYLRARGSYKNPGTKYTPYSETMTFVYSAAAGVDDLIDTAGGATVTGYYDLRGVRYDNPQPGVNIVRYSDGSARKLVIGASR